MKEGRALLVRHGETAWNVARRYQGHSDPPLNDLGQQQAYLLAACLADSGATIAYASDLQRAAATARTIAARAGAEVRLEPALRELSFGAFEGLLAAEIAARYPRESTAWWNNEPGSRPPGGESIAELDARLRTWWQRIRTQHLGETILVVAHGGSLNRLIAVMLELSEQSFYRFRLQNTAVSTVSWTDQRVVLEGLNDHCHLAVPA